MTVKAGVFCGFFVEMMEHERGWGCRPDGSLIFASEKAADEYIAEQYKGRDHRNVPDEYISYSKCGWKPISDKEESILAVKGRVYRG